MLQESNPDFYQRTRAAVKRKLKGLVDRVGMEYAIRARTSASVQEADEALRAVLVDHGYDVVAEVDVQAIHEHYDLAYPEFRILKVANPDVTRTALQLDPAMGVFLPLSVIVYDLDGETHVSAIRPSTLLALFTDPDLQEAIVGVESTIWAGLEQNLPDVEMLSTEPPLSPGGNGRAKRKKRLNLLLKLVDAEFTFRLSTDRPLPEVEQALRKSLGRRGQQVLAALDPHEGFRTLLIVNPGQAHKALAVDPDVAVFAPLSVSLYHEGGRTHVQAVRPSTLLIFFDHPALMAILQDLEMYIWNALVEALPGAELHTRQPPLPRAGGQRLSGEGLPGALGSARVSKV